MAVSPCQGGLGDIDPELQQLAMKPWHAPKRIIAIHCPDQIADVGRDRRPADTTARLPAPVETEAAPMPAHQRPGLENDRSSEQGREQPIQPDENQSTLLGLVWQVVTGWVDESPDATIALGGRLS